MRENRTSGSMRGCRKRAASRRACALLYQSPRFKKAPFLIGFGRGRAESERRLRPPGGRPDAVAPQHFKLVERLLPMLEGLPFGAGVPESQIKQLEGRFLARK